MKVFSPHKYILPNCVTLEKGESVVGELPAAAKKHLDKLVAGGVVKVLDEPKVEEEKLKASPFHRAPSTLEPTQATAKVTSDDAPADPVAVTTKKRQKSE